VAGKTADFLVTVKKVEAPNLPEVNEEFVKTLGVEGGSLKPCATTSRRTWSAK
jgi:trigger factor